MEGVFEGDRGEIGVGEVGEAGHEGRGAYRDGLVTGGPGCEDDVGRGGHGKSG